MARAGFDWLVVDLEHSMITFDQAQELIRTIDLLGVTPLVRLTQNEFAQAKRIMDAGAHGILVPSVNTKEEAERAVASVYYPERGKRGVGLARAQGFGADFDRYRAWLEKNAIVMVMIEHIDAVEQMDAILGVEGVDGYFIGPYDLSASMGIPGKMKESDFLAAVQKIQLAGKEANKPGGIHVVEPSRKEFFDRMKEGFSFLAYSADIRILDHDCRAFLSDVRLKMK